MRFLSVMRFLSGPSVSDPVTGELHGLVALNRGSYFGAAVGVGMLKEITLQLFV